MSDKELRIDYERATTQNVVAIRDYTKNTRDMVRAMQEEIKALKNIVGNYESQVSELRRQLAILQQRFYNAGTNTYGGNSRLGNKDD